MKKVMIGILGLLIFISGMRAWCASQPQSLGNVAIQLPNLTAAQVSVATATYKGQPIYCTDCASNGGAGTICISTAATAANQFILSSGTVCK